MSLQTIKITGSMEKDERKDMAATAVSAAVGGVAGRRIVEGLRLEDMPTEETEAASDEAATSDDAVAEVVVASEEWPGQLVVDEVADVYGPPPEVVEWENIEEIDDMMTVYGGPSMLEGEEEEWLADDMAPMYGPPPGM